MRDFRPGGSAECGTRFSIAHVSLHLWAQALAKSKPVPKKQPHKFAPSSSIPPRAAGTSILRPKVWQGNAGKLPVEISDRSVDLIVTSPPYWQKRDYGHEGQFGQEKKPEQFVTALVNAMEDWQRVLKPTGSIFLNIGDTYLDKRLAGIPSLVEAEVHNRKRGLILRNRIIWVKKTGMPDSARNRLASRHEYILHFAVNGYYYDLFGYAQKLSRGKSTSNPGDVWNIKPERNLGKHLAPFPKEIVRRAILLACPEKTCAHCGKPHRRIVEPSMQPNPNRPQSVRAWELAKKHGLTAEHFAAIRATGISDAGKALRVQSGTDRNSDEVKRLAAEAKKVLGGYFREFTFTPWVHRGWEPDCDCHADVVPGVVLDPFVGTGTTLAVAHQMKRVAYGVDLDITLAQKLIDGLDAQKGSSR